MSRRKAEDERRLPANERELEKGEARDGGVSVLRLYARFTPEFSTLAIGGDIWMIPCSISGTAGETEAISPFKSHRQKSIALENEHSR